ncbi:MAG: hypothetical protein ACRDTH_05690 [Pseudonocardiaceae bacterium]
MIREDRELLAELARINREMAALALRMMEGSASAAEQRSYARRLINVGEQLEQRAHKMENLVIDGLTLAADTIALRAGSAAVPVATPDSRLAAGEAGDPRRSAPGGQPGTNTRVNES